MKRTGLLLGFLAALLAFVGLASGVASASAKASATPTTAHFVIASEGSAVGFSDDSVGSAFQGLRGGGGHAIRHLMDAGLIPDAGSLASRVSQFQDITSPILTNPTTTFDYTVGTTPARAFVGDVDGQKIVVFVAKSGPYQGRVISAVVPDPPGQFAQFGVK